MPGTSPAMDAVTMQPHAAGVAPLSHAERAFVYRWLAGIFAREPSLDALETYRSGEGAALLSQLGREPTLAALAHDLVTRTAGEESLQPVVRELAGAFARLFLSVGGRRSAPPYESAYTNERGLLFQEAVDRVGESLSELGLTLPPGFPEPPDHIAVQLSVMAELANRCDGLAAGDELEALVQKQRSFLETRLMPWVPRFADDCIAFDRSGFYAAAAESLVAFLSSDGPRLRQGGA